MAMTRKNKRPELVSRITRYQKHSKKDMERNMNFIYYELKLVHHKEIVVVH